MTCFHPHCLLLRTPFVRAQVKSIRQEQENQAVEHGRTKSGLQHAENQLELARRNTDQEQVEVGKLREELKKKHDQFLTLERDNTALLQRLTEHKSAQQGLALKHEEHQLLSENELFNVRDALRIGQV